MTQEQARVALDCRSWLEESVIWDDRQSVFHWAGIDGKEVCRWLGACGLSNRAFGGRPEFRYAG